MLLVTCMRYANATRSRIISATAVTAAASGTRGRITTNSSPPYRHAKSPVRKVQGLCLAFLEFRQFTQQARVDGPQRFKFAARIGETRKEVAQRPLQPG